MKKFYLLLIVFLFTSICVLAKEKFDISFPLKGESIASPQLQYDSMMAVIPIASQYNKRCQSYSLADTKLVHGIKKGKVKDNKYIEGYWKESWTVNRCSQQVVVPILFTLDGKGGAYYNVKHSEVKVIK